MLRWIATCYLLRLARDPDWSALPHAATLPDDDWLPILVRCRDLDDPQLGGNLDDVIVHVLRRAELEPEYLDVLHEMLRDELHAGRALLLIDGLDEIVDPRVRARFCQQLERFHVAHPAAPIVITSRIVGYREMGYRFGDGFEHVTVADLTREDKEDFAQRWYALTEPVPARRQAAARSLISDIHSTDRIERLTANPMLLTTMALVKRKVGRLPSRRADLFAEAIEVLLNWRREVDEPLNYQEAVPQLEYIAYAMCDRGVQRLREDELLNLIDRMRDEYPRVHAARVRPPHEFVRLLERRTGILSETGTTRHEGRSVPVYEFRHLSLQEYLAGLALVHGRFPGRNRADSLADNIARLAGKINAEPGRASDDGEAGIAESWREPIRLCVTSCNDDDVHDALRAVLTPVDGEDFKLTARPRAVLAALCLADEPNAGDEVARETLATLVAHVRRDGEQEDEPLTALGRAAREVSGCRWAAVFHELLIRAVLDRPSSQRVGVATLYVAGVEAGLPEASQAITGHLAQATDRLSASDAREIVVDQIMACLDVGALARFRSDDLRREAVDLEATVDALVDRVRLESPARQMAAWALAQLDRTGLHGARRLSRSTIELALGLLLDRRTDTETQKHLMQLLGSHGTRRAVEPILMRVDDAAMTVRRAAAKALGQLGDRRALPALVHGVTTWEGAARADAIAALGELSDDRGAEPILTCLDDEDADVRAQAALALGYLVDRS
jgi:hypothetical protein